MQALPFSIIIPTWNNLPFLKLCIASIRKNSACAHQIIVHVNEGTDGTLEWVRQEGLDYTYSTRNIGVCMACNMMRTKVRTDYILYLNDDMYLLPDWDTVLAAEIASLPNNRFYLSGTMIQPHNRLDVGILADYGDTVENFEESRLLREYKNYTMRDWHGATWPPSLLHRDIWDLVGGYSIEYTPGMYSDPDLTAKLYMAGVRHFKGLSDCRAYHFETKSTGRIRKNNGSIQFLMKWGVTNSYLRRYITHLGKTFIDEGVGEVPSPTPSHKHFQTAAKYHKIRSRLKAAWALLSGRQFGPIEPLE
ncbi:MAG: glycosyltransferase family 2 protein [Bacteroidales bacterium]|nr:glycosyltransferase family 2 protein [Bacteroidales bacterium]